MTTIKQLILIVPMQAVIYYKEEFNTFWAYAKTFRTGILMHKCIYAQG